jgi:hypothetical protein
LVLGDPSDHIFPVKIAANESVGSLKNFIKVENTPAFDHAPANTLILRKVSVSNDHSLPEKLTDVEFANGVPLLPMDRLSKVFSGAPKEGHPHIIVKPPSIGKCP